MDGRVGDEVVGKWDVWQVFDVFVVFVDDVGEFLRIFVNVFFVMF